MINLIKNTIAESIRTKQNLAENSLDDIAKCAELLIDAVRENRMIAFAGNGGSAADAQHIAAELVVRFRGSVNRRAIRAMSLAVDPSIMTAGGNDIGFENVFAREVEAYCSAGDVLVGISTSGNSGDIINAMNIAKSRGTKTIGLLGCEGGKILPLCDAAVVVPSNITARIQESHIMIGHIWCDLIERAIFPEMF
ncbi:MAG: SIS domain-containing protein [Candidatus Kapabacteria bacterium]|nr:SIS domain-containing protein [Candidatus Kapabacteria bacterium]